MRSGQFYRSALYTGPPPGVSGQLKSPAVSAPTTTIQPRHKQRTEQITPIDLSDAHNYVADELWAALCDGLTSPWLVQLGAVGRNQPDFDATRGAWSEALAAHAGDSVTSTDAAVVRARLEEHAAEVARNRRIYSYTVPQQIRHRYWPTGAREHLERENLYTMNLCPKQDRFITPRTKIASAGSCFAFEIGAALRAWSYNYFVTEPGPAHLGERQRRERMYGLFSARYDAKPGSTYLFRPDQYLTARFREYDEKALLAAHDRALGRIS